MYRLYAAMYPELVQRCPLALEEAWKLLKREERAKKADSEVAGSGERFNIVSVMGNQNAVLTMKEVERMFDEVEKERVDGQIKKIEEEAAPSTIPVETEAVTCSIPVETEAIPNIPVEKEAVSRTFPLEKEVVVGTIPTKKESLPSTIPVEKATEKNGESKLSETKTPENEILTQDYAAMPKKTTINPTLESHVTKSDQVQIRDSSLEAKPLESPSPRTKNDKGARRDLRRKSFNRTSAEVLHGEKSSTTARTARDSRKTKATSENGSLSQNQKRVQRKDLEDSYFHHEMPPPFHPPPEFVGPEMIPFDGYRSRFIHPALTALRTAQYPPYPPYPFPPEYYPGQHHFPPGNGNW
mmetsp:Transcript_45043/g.63061  ORF Transcript_45043/g.63061 Transcript_45043/m.63061 type:complete len:354 (+) Transcript_45043:2-1063(+)